MTIQIILVTCMNELSNWAIDPLVCSGLKLVLAYSQSPVLAGLIAYFLKKKSDVVVEDD